MGRSLTQLCLTSAWLAFTPLHAQEIPTFKLEMKDGVISPARLEIPAGKAFQLEIRNSGKTAAEFECKPLKKEKVVVPGATATLSFKATAPGQYVFVDEFHENLPTGRGLIVLK